MQSVPFDIVIFDLDGTLADTAPDLAAALNHALLSLGRPAIPAAAVRNMIGHGARTLVERGLAATGGGSACDVDRALTSFLDYYGVHMAHGTTALAGVDDALTQLTRLGIRLAICTNKPERLTHKLVQALGWKDRFVAVIGGDTLPVRKPDPAPVLAAIARAGGGKAAFVGDSINDVAAAQAAGIPVVALSFGYSDRPAAELGADVLIDRYEQLLPALEALG